ncbi:MAG TPA: GIY-YIG nuclease family protein [Ktedonobacteraceae bacterium]|nr:GIY-YIG nuclease family protein [Ktedonobacteraceae bacterium]
MNRRKEITNEYKERKLRGGVYIITNSLNGKYLIGYAANLKSVQNHFQFALTTGSTLHPRLRKDWEEMGATAFTLGVLEELEQKPEQSQVEFMDDLKTLEQLLRANFDASKEY